MYKVDYPKYQRLCEHAKDDQGNRLPIRMSEQEMREEEEALNKLIIGNYAL